MALVFVAVGLLVLAVVGEPILSRRVAWQIREWATERGYRLVSIKRLWGSRGAWGWTFRSLAEGSACRFFDITTIDERSIERVGTAKVRSRFYANGEEPIEVRWSSERQLSPGHPGEQIHGNDELVTEGWGADPTQRHEQRWFSAGTPTALVRDGRVEGHDPVSDRHESDGSGGS